MEEKEIQDTIQTDQTQQTQETPQAEAAVAEEQCPVLPGDETVEDSAKDPLALLIERCEALERKFEAMAAEHAAEMEKARLEGRNELIAQQMKQGGVWRDSESPASCGPEVEPEVMILSSMRPSVWE